MQFRETWKERLRPYLGGLIRSPDPTRDTGLYILVDDKKSGLQTAWLPVSEVVREDKNKQSITFRSSLLRSITDLLESFDPTSLTLLEASALRNGRSFRTVVLPSTVPFILTGLRLGVGKGIVGVMVGELYAATAGIGFMITVAGATFQADKVFVGVLVFCPQRDDFHGVADAVREAV